MLMKMTDILTYIIYATIGAFIALLLKESFAWKGQGRVEAIKRYENLLIDCYGKLKPLIDRLEIEDEYIMFNRVTHELIEDIVIKFSFRIPENIKEKCDHLLYGNEVIEGLCKLKFKSYDEAKSYWLDFITSIIEIMDDINIERKKLESYTQSLIKRIWYIAFVWNFRNKGLVD